MWKRMLEQAQPWFCPYILSLLEAVVRSDTFRLSGRKGSLINSS
jgi:hypothetical protein